MEKSLDSVTRRDALFLISGICLVGCEPSMRTSRIPRQTESCQISREFVPDPNDPQNLAVVSGICLKEARFSHMDISYTWTPPESDSDHSDPNFAHQRAIIYSRPQQVNGKRVWQSWLDVAYPTARVNRYITGETEYFVAVFYERDSPWRVCAPVSVEGLGRTESLLFEASVPSAVRDPSRVIQLKIRLEMTFPSI